jgi:DNA-binding MarR family transcriptional regulator
MKNYQKVIDKYFESVKNFNEFERNPRDFGTGDLLYSSEIHTLVAIGNKGSLNLTELSYDLDITKGGTSKFVKKLLEKELIIKEKLHDNRKETFFRLTDRGVIAYEGHEVFSREMFGDIIDNLSELSEGELNTLSGFLESLNNSINGRK